ncbi:MAG: HAD family hydrolase, partial [Chitinivibrionales bacterium]
SVKGDRQADVDDLVVAGYFVSSHFSGISLVCLTTSKQGKGENVKLKGVVFDLDGTLLDTLDDLAESMNRVLSSFDYPTHPVEAYRYFVGEGMRTLAFRVLPEQSRDEESVKRTVDAMRRDYAMHWADKTRPYYGVPKMLNHLQDKGVHMAILSNKPDEFTAEVVEKLLPHWRFKVVRGAREAVPLKPDPQSAVALSQEMGISPAHLAFVGDTATDMKTAVSAGMYPVGVLWGFREAGELKENGAKRLIESPSDLVDLF